MQLAFSAWAMRDLPVGQQISIVREAGYTGIELVSNAGAAIDAVGMDAAARQQLRAQFEGCGLEITAVDGHARLAVSDPERRTANRARVQAAIDLAADLAGPSGPPCVVCMGYGKPETYVQERQAIADGFAEVAAYAAQRGVVVALEPHVGQAIDLPEKVVWLMERVGSPSFRLNLDNSHFEVMGRDLADYLPVLVPLSVHTHLKDQRGIYPDYAFLTPGDGEFDYARYLTAMQDAGYGGFVTIEISSQVQKDPGYDPAHVAAQSFRTLVSAAEQAGVPLAHH